MKKTIWNTDWTVAPGVPDAFGAIFGSGPKPQPVTLPQDAMILEERDPQLEAGQQAGFYPVKSYTYEKKFFAPEDWRDLRTMVELEGVMSRAMVYLNGELVARNAYGYAQFFADLTSCLRYGEENLLRVLALGSPRGSRWYPGAGIYRDVNLWQGALAHIDPEGVRLNTEALREGYAAVAADVELVNDGLEARKLRLALTLTGPDGRETTAENVVSLLERERVHTHLRLFVDDPALWSPDAPNLYRYAARLLDGDSVVDTAEGCFGIRTVEADARRGLAINGVQIKLRGACIHHDNGILGTTTLPDAEEFRLRAMKAAGFNAIRSAHHPAGKALLDACDRLGILVMDEIADMWEVPKNSGDYAFDFVEEWPQTLRRVVAKDWNHPSVILYSLGNEIPEIGRRSGGRRNRELANALRALDPTRLITGAFSGFLAMADRVEEMTVQMREAEADLQKRAELEAAGSEALNAAMSKMARQRMDAFSTSQGLSETMEEASCELDVVGYNYLTARHEYEHAAHPERVVVGSETYPTEIARLWRVVRDNAHVIGDFTWTGYDYLGEAGLACYHYAPERREQGWYPDRLAYCGDINLNGYRRPVSYLREIAYGMRKAPFIAVERLDRYGQEDNTNDWKYYDALDSWTFPGWEGKPTVAHVLSSSDEVELFLNGVSLGRKQAGEAVELEAAFELAYAPGTLEAVGYTNGREDGRFVLKTADAPARLQVTASREALIADPGAVAFLTVDLVDANGVSNRWDSRAVTATVEGPAVLAGFGSADPQAEGSYQASTWKTFDGRVLAAIRSTGEPGTVRVTFTAEGCAPAAARLTVDKE